MRIGEPGLGAEQKTVNQEMAVNPISLNPQSTLPNPVFMERVRWRCRRGLLELDIVLGRFIKRHYLNLDEAQRQAFDIQLDMPDTKLWDMIAGNGSQPQHDDHRAVLEMLQTV